MLTRVCHVVTLMAQDMHDKGYTTQEEYLDADDEVVGAEVIDVDER
jgi:hypothetical protein